MSTPPTYITVNLADLTKARATAREAASPLIRWNESPEKMRDRADQARRDALKELDNLLTFILASSGH
jgi:hypothetical protein